MKRLTGSSPESGVTIRYPDITFDGTVNMFGNLANWRYFLSVTCSPPYMIKEA
ncbi:MAG TPA: hypothetical protein VLD38_01075 [Nitrosopumilaceae archaeon]|nr:hypothetical protein [Nitrosopumilaceae archaeon]